MYLRIKDNINRKFLRHNVLYRIYYIYTRLYWSRRTSFFGYRAQCRQEITTAAAAAAAAESTGRRPRPGPSTYYLYLQSRPAIGFFFYIEKMLALVMLPLRCECIVRRDTYTQQRQWQVARSIYLYCRLDRDGCGGRGLVAFFSSMPLRNYTNYSKSASYFSTVQTDVRISQRTVVVRCRWY